MDKVLDSDVNKRKTVIIFSILGIGALFVIAHFLGLTESESKTLSAFEQHQIRFDINVPDTNISRDMYLNLKAAIAVDNQTKDVLYCYNAKELRAVASISKLLTAMVVIDHYQPDSILTITKLDAKRSARSLFRTGDRARLEDFLHAALLQSDNRSARALARNVAGSYEKFAEMMNKKAEEIGLNNTVMYEPTGLDERNCSNAADIVRILNVIVSHYPEISNITSKKRHSFKLLNRNKTVNLINTNKMVFSKYKVLAGKTGYIIESDYCLATILENADGKQISVVVLGSPGPQTRFREARRLANYAFNKAG
ncbi:MAG: D-alanyl-D-alanine carboxypeptidase [candidate division Zixibacteria bacterium]|nr:D-alanyl-D-alanine carboxypeptidase [candidate division Zixibacteria bacterium]